MNFEYRSDDVADTCDGLEVVYIDVFDALVGMALRNEEKELVMFSWKWSASDLPERIFGSYPEVNQSRRRQVYLSARLSSCSFLKRPRGLGKNVVCGQGPSKLSALLLIRYPTP